MKQASLVVAPSSVHVSIMLTMINISTRVFATSPMILRYLCFKFKFEVAFNVSISRAKVAARRRRC